MRLHEEGRGAGNMSEVTVESIEKSPAYVDDYYLWWEHQLKLMQTGRWAELDFENVADEFRDLGIQHRHTAESVIKKIIVHLIAIKVCGSDHFVRDETIGYWKKEIRSFRGSLLETLADSPGLKGILTKDYARLWKYSMEPLLRKLSDMDAIGEPHARKIVKEFNQSPCFPIEECVGFNLNEHKRNMAAIDYEGKWLYPPVVRDTIEQAEKSMERQR